MRSDDIKLRIISVVTMCGYRGSCKARAAYAHVGRCRMGRGAARRWEMLLATPARPRDWSVVAGAAAGCALRATDAHGTRTLAPVSPTPRPSAFTPVPTYPHAPRPLARSVPRQLSPAEIDYTPFCFFFYTSSNVPLFSFMFEFTRLTQTFFFFSFFFVMLLLFVVTRSVVDQLRAFNRSVFVCFCISPRLFWL